MEDYKVKCVLGKGSFGKVRLVKKKSEDSSSIKSFAAKEIKKKHEESFIAERDILMKVKNPFVVQFLDSFEWNNIFVIVMEFVGGGTLFDVLKKNFILTECQAKFYMAEVTLGLEYLHSQQILYRDLKDSNILISEGGHVKLSDFGLSEKLSDGPSYEVCGTPEYMAPEIYTRTGHGLPVDWWALGVLFYKMIVGSYPFKPSSTTDISFTIMMGEFDVPEELSEETKDLVCRLLKISAQDRLGFNGAHEIKRHEFFKNTSWENVLHCLEAPPFVSTNRFIANNDKSSYFMSYTTSSDNSVSVIDSNNKLEFSSSCESSSSFNIEDF